MTRRGRQVEPRGSLSPGELSDEEDASIPRHRGRRASDSFYADDSGYGGTYGTPRGPNPYKMTNRAWPLFDPDKHRWDEFKARTVLKALRMGANERDVVANLADVLPGEAIIYLENRGIAGRSLGTVLKHLDGLYRTTLASNPVMAQSQLDKLSRGPREPAYRYARRVMVLATAAAVAGEDIDLKAQRALVKGINCEVTGPKLRKAQEKPGCTFAELVKVAELTESRNLLRRDDPVMTKYISDVANGSNPVRTMGTEPSEGTPTYRVEVVGDGGVQNHDNNRYAGATCFKCGQVGHIRPTCPSTGPDKRLDPQNSRRRPNGSNNSNRGGGQQGRGGRNTRSSDNQGGDNRQNERRSDSSSGTTVPPRMVAPAMVIPPTGQTADRPPPIVEQTEVVAPIHTPSEQTAPIEERTPNEGLDTAPINAMVLEPRAPIDSIELSQTGSSSVCQTEPALRSQIGTTAVDRTGSTGKGSIRNDNAPSEDNSNQTEPRGWLAPVHVNGILMMLAVDTGASILFILLLFRCNSEQNSIYEVIRSVNTLTSPAASCMNKFLDPIG
jgi:hypothetical protein